jgi:fimbrial isopeptide formation D2 family protein
MQRTPLSGSQRLPFFARKTRNKVPPRPATPWRPRLGVESLEGRLTPSITATTVSSSLASTQTPNVTIGEVVRMRVIVPEQLAGDFDPAAFNVVGTLPAGLQYLSGTADLAVVSNKSVVSTYDPNNTGGLNVTGNPNVTTVTPTFVLPSSAVTVNNSTVTFNTGIKHSNDDGTVVDNIVLEFNALVTNVAGNQAAIPTTLNSSFMIYIGGTTCGCVGNNSLTVVEPTINNEVKTATLNANGNDVSYTVTFSNTGNSTAYDVHVTDTMPDGLTVDAGSVKVTGNGVNLQNNSTATGLDLFFDSLAGGGSVTVTYSATVPASDFDGHAIVNTAKLDYTSLPGLQGTNPNPTGTQTPGNSGATNGERNGTGGVNDYFDSASASVSVTPKTTSISGFVYFDGNSNGAKDVNEVGLPGVRVQVTDANGAPVVDASGTPLQVITTDQNGFFQFNNLTPNTYRVSELPPAPTYNGGPLLQGQNTAGTVNGVYRGVVHANVITGVALAGGEHSINNDFGWCPPSQVGSMSISGTVYFDTNVNNVLDGPDKLVPGVTMHLYRTDNSPTPVEVARTTTNEFGYYLFEIATPGIYMVVENDVPGMFKESDQLGTVNGSVRGSVVAIDALGEVHLSPGDNGVNYNFALLTCQPPSKQGLLATPPPPMITPPPFANYPSFANIDRSGVGGTHYMAVGADAGSTPTVWVYNFSTGQVLGNFMAYSSQFRGGVRVAVGDVTGDGVPDVVTAPGAGGGPDIRVFDGKTGALVREFFAYAPTFTGGVYIATGDVNGDGIPDIITGAGSGGGPHVEVWDGATGKLAASFFAYAPNFVGGVRIAAGDFNQDGLADIVTGPGAGGGPDVRIFNSATLGVPGSVPTLMKEVFAFAPTYTGGVYVAANAYGGGDINGDGVTDLVVGTGSGVGQVRAFDGASLGMIADFTAYGSSMTTNGARVSVFDMNRDGRADIVAGSGGGKGAYVRVVDLNKNGDADFFQPFDPSFLGGVWVSAA